MGGHGEYPKPMNCRIYLYYDRIQLENPDLIIPYESLTNIENMDEKKISAKRVIGLGLVFVPLAIVGAMWKKNHIYTVIQYNDEVGEKIIILDFGKNVDDFQGWIYRRIISSRMSTTTTFSNGEFMIYENQQYDFRMKYAKIWIRDELNQRTQDYITVVEFRMFIENKYPFVTVYLNNVEPNQLSFDEFVNREIEVSKNDPYSSFIVFSSQF